jgi:uncharacterized pyridoxal phosphate-dependent enzyme
MFSRRRFIGSLSTLPLVGGFFTRDLLGADSAAAGLAQRRGAALAGDAAAGGRDYFAELGLRPFINAAGTYTDMTASLMQPEVMQAINYAAGHYVMLDELQDKVGERIAKIVRAEAAMVTAGAASAMTLGTAGVLTGTDRNKMINLPYLLDMKSEVIMQKSHRFGYDHAVRNCGVRIIEVETVAELERAINPQTAMMLFYNNNNTVGLIPDHEFVRLGKKHNVPTFNDAAADVPPVENLWKYTEMGFDLVCFSGGKGLRGPQSAGLLVGRKDLIQAARLNAPPNGNTIGRGMKVNKEEVLGMLVALELFLQQDHIETRRDYDQRAEAIQRAATSVPGVKAEIFVPEIANHVPHIRLAWDANQVGISPEHVVRLLRDGTPSIRVRPGSEIVVGVWMMRPGEAEVVARRLREVLTKRT